MKIWAPGASQVDVVLEPSGERLAMRKVDRHHHELGQELPAGTDYRLSLDGGPPLADPRSGWQPEGVNAPSRVVDHTGFAWSDDRWQGLEWPATAIYEMHVGTFSPEGTFDGAAARLEHLVDLGVDVVELMPVAQFPGFRGWGYDGVHLYAPHRGYGGPEAMKRFVDRAHQLGLAVMLDVVYNHLGPLGNRLGEFGPYFTGRYSTPWGDAVNLDGPGSDGVRAHICDNARMWIRDYHIDGLRLDAVHAFLDLSALHLIEEIGMAAHDEGQRAGRAVAVVAESELNDPRIIRPRERGGHGLEAVWADDFHHALHVLLTGEQDGYYADFGDISHLADAWSRNWIYDGRYSPARDRRHGLPADQEEPCRFVVALQNHDQIGNRAAGERIGHLAGAVAQRLGATVTLLAPQVPLIFQGEEWGASTPFPYFIDHPDPDLAEAVREGRQKEFAAFGWRPEDIPDPQAQATFDSAVLNWDELAQGEHAETLEIYKRLLRLRRDLPRAGAGTASAEPRGGRAITLRRPGAEIRADFDSLEVSLGA